MFSKRDYSVCKCAIKSDRMVKMLVKFYNAIMKHDHFLNRQLDVLDVMIEKGKENKINKLRVIQIIESDLQLTMRIFLRNKGKT